MSLPKSITEWKEKHFTSYNWAKECGKLEELALAMGLKYTVPGTWQDIENIKNFLRKHQFKTLSEWKKEHQGSYRAARRYGFLTEIRAEFFQNTKIIKANGIWKDIENIKDLLRKHQFKNIYKWKKSHSGSYSSAQRYGFIPQIKAEFFPDTTIQGTWQDIENIKNLLKQRNFKTISEWGKNHGSSYQGAVKTGFIPQIKAEFFPTTKGKLVNPEASV